MCALVPERGEENHHIESNIHFLGGSGGDTPPFFRVVVSTSVFERGASFQEDSSYAERLLKERLTF